MNEQSLRPPANALSREQHRSIERALTQPHPSRRRVGLEDIVLKAGDTFLISDHRGDLPRGQRGAALGLFREDTRFLSLYELTLNGRVPRFLSNEHHIGCRTVHELENGKLPGLDDDCQIPAHTISLRRERTAQTARVREIIHLTNFAQQPARIRVVLRFASDFADLLAIRGMARGIPGRELISQLHGSAGVCLVCLGEDGRKRLTQLELSPRASLLDSGSAQFDMTLQAGRPRAIAIEITVATIEPQTARKRGARSGASGAHAELHASSSGNGRGGVVQGTKIHAAPLFAKVLERGLLDLSILRTRRPDGLQYIAGGVPWFVTLFGRDSMWAAMQVCAFDVSIARETLLVLAKYQATRVDSYHAAEPGKLPHELREGQLAHLGKVPQSPLYYGSVDATPLFLILLGEYVSWSADLELARQLRPHVDAALSWIDRYGDSDGDGYLDYCGAYKHGLVNQGWKDSGDAIVNADGSLARPPIALSEVQGYLYRAWLSTAKVLELLGDRSAAAELLRQASGLRERFERDFWSPELNCYMLARQEGGRPAAVTSSNAGQVLWSGLPLREHATATAVRLMAPDMFSGWGVRTLSSREIRFNPLSYHLGSVWPHDNSIILSGLRRYGYNREALRIFSGLYAAACGFRDYRVPELFCGFDRTREQRHPVRYPVACSPQAWAAGALPYALVALLGLEADAPKGRLYIRDACLPEGLDQVCLRRLRIGQAELDLTFRHLNNRIDIDAVVHTGKVSVERLAPGDI